MLIVDLGKCLARDSVVWMKMEIIWIVGVITDRQFGIREVIFFSLAWNTTYTEDSVSNEYVLITIDKKFNLYFPLNWIERKIRSSFLTVPNNRQDMALSLKIIETVEGLDVE